MIHTKLALLSVISAPTVFGQDEPALTNCFDPGNFTSPGCTDPRDVGVSQLCPTLPDCPSWCDPADDTYCTATKVDGSTVDKYATEYFPPPVIVNRNGKKNTLAVREFLQQILPESQNFKPTRVWGYGDPKFPGVSFHNPAATIEATQNSPLRIALFNDLVKDPEACRCNATDVEEGACEPLPHILQDCNGVPVVDTKLHWANPAGPSNGIASCAHHDGFESKTDCTGNYSYVYDGPVPSVLHVHGAHAIPESDGYTEAWFLPPNTAEPYSEGGTWYDTFAPQFEASYHTENGACPSGVEIGGYEANIYGNDESTANLFFHDHTLGMTRLNVMATSAGFYFIRNPNCVYNNGAGLKWLGESGIVDCGSSILPGPPPLAELYTSGNPNNEFLGIPNWFEKPPYADETIRELPIAMQDMSFYDDVAKGETRQFYSANHDAFLECCPQSDGPDCDKDTADLVPCSNGERWGCNNDNGNDAYQDQERPVPPIWNPEIFFDVMVVNGRAWPEHQVRPNRYRLRLLNACDSRTLILQFWAALPSSRAITSFDDLWDNENVTEIAINVIGDEHGLLPRGPASVLSGGYSNGTITKYNCGEVEGVQEGENIKGLLVQPGERYDVMVDFEGLPQDTLIYMINTGPNEPFKKLELVNDDNRVPFNTVGQVMRFNVSHPFDEDNRASSVTDLCFDENPGGTPPLGEVDKNRTVYLKEEVTEEGFGPSLADSPFAAVLDNVRDDPEEGKGWAKPITENIKVNQVEQWEIVNLSADSHPIHLHQINFLLKKRCVTNETCEEGDGVFGYETGKKDTVVAFPNVDDEGEPIGDGFSTFIQTRFDILGIYVWHCHILSHEDNEMMRPLCVYDPEDLNTLNKCCPDGTVYNKTHWDETELLADAGDPKYSGPELLCDSCEEVDECACHNKKECKKDYSESCVWENNQCVDAPLDNVKASSAVHQEKPWGEIESSSSHAGMSISAALAGMFLAYLWI